MKILIVYATFLVTNFTFAADMQLSGKTSTDKFVEHTDNSAFGSWLGLNLEFAPFNTLRQDVEKIIKYKLTNRGEAHITVVTPPEYDKVLKAHLKIQDINKIAKDFKIQSATWKAECVGTASLVIDNKTESTYFVVVTSDELIKLRHKIKQAFEQNGGDRDSFVPEKYQPHVTLGYTKRDLHFEDGVSKDKISCWKTL